MGLDTHYIKQKYSYFVTGSLPKTPIKWMWQMPWQRWVIPTLSSYCIWVLRLSQQWCFRLRSSGLWCCTVLW